jgi:hypothetical protein
MLFFIEEEFHVHLPSEGVTFGSLGEAAQYIDGLIATQTPAAQSDARMRPDPTA